MKPILTIASFSSGSTYFQRATTFWINELLDSKISNPHELLNGIAYHEGYLIKSWTKINDQSLTDIQSLLTSSSNLILARLAYDHMMSRNESESDTKTFYDFLKEHFDIYVCYRNNLFDYGLCWAVRRCTNRDFQFQINNVHTVEDRIKLYGEDKIFSVDPDIIIEQAEKYLEYVNWTKENFPDATPIYYEDLEENIDCVLEKHFPAKSTIKNKFGVSIAEYSLYQYQLSKNLPTQLTTEQIVGVEKIKFILDEMCREKRLLDTIPIKSTTMTDKFHKIINFDECILKYNQWLDNNHPDFEPVTSGWLDKLTARENLIYN